MKPEHVSVHASQELLAVLPEMNESPNTSLNFAPSDTPGSGKNFSLSFQLTVVLMTLTLM